MRSTHHGLQVLMCKRIAALNGMRLAMARQKSRKGTVRRLRRVMYPRMQRPASMWWPLQPSKARTTKVIHD